jgi:hypothetical protein
MDTWALFSDRETTSLALCPVPGWPVPDPPPAPRLLDKIDAAPPLWPRFGEHAAAASDGTVSVLYLDREREDRTVLKLATGRPAGAEWRLDVLEPLGLPVAVVVLDSGRFAPVWADDSSLLYRPAAGPDQVLRQGFRLEGRGCPIDGGRGFTVYDGGSGRLLWFRFTGSGIEAGEVDGPGPVHASVLVPGREPAETRLAVASWDPETRKVLLYEQQAGGGFARTTVTICEGTSALFLEPWGRGWLFLYDEVRTLGGGRTLSEVSVLAPDGPRYRRRAVSSGDGPVEGLSAALRGDALEVAVLRGELSILRVTPPPPGAGRYSLR